jgi:beta-aspartyl-dipeptidase (metallo-type)
MLTVIRNATVFAPEPIGVQQVLIAGGRIAALAPQVDLHGSELTVVDAEGLWLLPGFVDALTHPCGGGGEGGFQNRTREVELASFVTAGVTTPVGALGTDSITRSLDVLYGSVMALRARGLNALMYSGAYRVPAPTLTGDLARDLLLIEPVVGAGEVAISDHRSSEPTVDELRRLAADVRLGGLLAGKGGTVLVHVGDGSARLAPLRDALTAGNLPADSFYPTHSNRTRELYEEALDLARAGAFIDFTVPTMPEFIAAGEVPALDALLEGIDRGVPAGRMSLSSDAGGSLPRFEAGRLVGLQAATPAPLLDLFGRAIADHGERIAEVLAALTRNPADALGLADRGRIAVGASADLLLLDPATTTLNHVFCNGRALLRNGDITVPELG